MSCYEIGGHPNSCRRCYSIKVERCSFCDMNSCWSGLCNSGRGQLKFPTLTRHPTGQAATPLRMVFTGLLYLHYFSPFKAAAYILCTFPGEGCNASIIIIHWRVLIFTPTSSVGQEGYYTGGSGTCVLCLSSVVSSVYFAECLQLSVSSLPARLRGVVCRSNRRWASPQGQG
jgi:hypothetical protein